MDTPVCRGLEQCPVQPGTGPRALLWPRTWASFTWKLLRWPGSGRCRSPVGTGALRTAARRPQNHGTAPSEPLLGLRAGTGEGATGRGSGAAPVRVPAPGGDSCRITGAVGSRSLRAGCGLSGSRAGGLILSSALSAPEANSHRGVGGNGGSGFPAVGAGQGHLFLQLTFRARGREQRGEWVKRAALHQAHFQVNVRHKSDCYSKNHVKLN